MDKLLQKYASRDDMPLLEAARLRILPDKLLVMQIAWLYYSEKADEAKRRLFCIALNEAGTKGDLKAEIISEQKPVRIAIKINGRPINPDARDEYRTVQYYLVHRNDYRAFLEANGEWPPAPSALIANWFELEIPSAEELIEEIEDAEDGEEALNELGLLFEKVSLTAFPKRKRLPNADEILDVLKERCDDFDSKKIIIKIEGESIHWQPTDGTAVSVAGKKRLQNIVSKIRKIHKNSRL